MGGAHDYAIASGGEVPTHVSSTSIARSSQSTVNMLVLRRIAGCLCEGINTNFCRALSSRAGYEATRVPIKDIASSAPHDISEDITVLVSLHLKF